MLRVKEIETNNREYLSFGSWALISPVFSVLNKLLHQIDNNEQEEQISAPKLLIHLS